MFEVVESLTFDIRENCFPVNTKHVPRWVWFISLLAATDSKRAATQNKTKQFKTFTLNRNELQKILSLYIVVA